MRKRYLGDEAFFRDPRAIVEGVEQCIELIEETKYTIGELNSDDFAEPLLIFNALDRVSECAKGLLESTESQTQSFQRKLDAEASSTCNGGMAPISLGLEAHDGTTAAEQAHNATHPSSNSVVRCEAGAAAHLWAVALQPDVEK